MMSEKKEQEKEVDFRLCIICQKKSDENLVENPVSHEKLLKFIEERVLYGDSQFSEVWTKLKSISPEELISSKASWHRNCYQDAVHTGKLKRVKERHERELSGPDESRRKTRVPEVKQLTRSKTSPYDKNVCFFCEKAPGYRESLHSVCTTSAGQSLQAAIESAGNDKLLVKLSTAIDASDAHAIDVKYHKKCWASNVTSVVRRVSTDKGNCKSVDSAEIAAEIEFLDTTEMVLREGKIPTMADLEAAYNCILQANHVVNPTCSRKKLKQLISTEIPDVGFHKPKRKNESERVSIKEARDAAIQLSEEACPKRSEQIRTLYDAAVLLRKCINRCKKWVFTGSLDNASDEHIPPELYCFFRWVV